MRYTPNERKYLYMLNILSNDNTIINTSFILQIWKYLIKTRYENVFLASVTNTTTSCALFLISCLSIIQQFIIEIKNFLQTPHSRQLACNIPHQSGTDGMRFQWRDRYTFAL